MMLDHEPDAREKRQHIFNIPTVIIVIVLFCVAAYVIPELFFSGKNFAWFYEYFAFVPAFFTQRPFEFSYTLITHSFLHGGISHIAINMLWLVIFGAPLAARLGTIRFLLFWCFTAIVAALAYYLVHSDSMIPLVRASGAISGMMGGAARFGFLREHTRESEGRSEFTGPMLTMYQSITNRTVLSFIGFWFVANLVTGLASADPSGNGPSIAWEAHMGGMVAGFFFVGLFDRRRYNV